MQTEPLRGCLLSLTITFRLFENTKAVTWHQLTSWYTKNEEKINLTPADATYVLVSYRCSIYAKLLTQ